MVTIVIFLKPVQSFLTTNVIALSKLLDRFFKIAMDLIFSNATDSLVTFIHRQVDEVVQVGEHAHLAKLCHTGKQGELDASVHGFQHAVEGFQRRAEAVLQFGMGDGRQQRLVILVYQDNYSLARLLIRLPYHILETLTSLVKRGQGAVLLFQRPEKGIKLLIERLFGLIFAHVQVEMEYQVFRPVLLQLFHGKSLEEFLLAREIRVQGRDEQALAEPSGAAQEIITSFVNQAVYQRRLVNVNITVVA